jgi:hypothetical protein
MGSRMSVKRFRVREIGRNVDRVSEGAAATGDRAMVSSVLEACQEV